MFLGDSVVLPAIDGLPICSRQLVFQTTVRSITSQEIADDPALVAQLKNLYDILDSRTTPTTIPLPWLSAPSILKKLLATKEVYDIVSRAIDIRVKSGKIQNDTLQMLIDAQDERLVMVGVSNQMLVFWHKVDFSLVHNGFTCCGSQSDWYHGVMAHNLSWQQLGVERQGHAGNRRTAVDVLSGSSG